MNKYINEYIASKQYAWALSTQRSEMHRLNGIKHLIGKNPQAVWGALQAQKPYTRVTTWTRLVEYYDFLIANGHVSGTNKYREWRKANAKAFKNVYEKKVPSLSFGDARARVESIQHAAVRQRAEEILLGGLRSIETIQEDNNGNSFVLGKGNKIRRVYVKKSTQEQPSYSSLRAGLISVGLKPHHLRKLFAMELAKTANVFELTEAMGWTNLNTAQSYIKANEDSLRQKVEALQAQGGADNEVRKGIPSDGWVGQVRIHSLW